MRRVLNTRTLKTGLFYSFTHAGNSRDGKTRVRVVVPHPSFKGSTRLVTWTYFEISNS